MSVCSMAGNVFCIQSIDLMTNSFDEGAKNRKRQNRIRIKTENRRTKAFLRFKFTKISFTSLQIIE